MCIQQLLQKSVNKLRASYELVAGITVIFQSHVMRCYMMFASSPVEGASAPLCVPFLHSVLYLSGESGTSLQVFY